MAIEPTWKLFGQSTQLPAYRFCQPRRAPVSLQDGELFQLRSFPNKRAASGLPGLGRVAVGLLGHSRVASSNQRMPWRSCCTPAEASADDADVGGTGAGRDTRSEPVAPIGIRVARRILEGALTCFMLCHVGRLDFNPMDPGPSNKQTRRRRRPHSRTRLKKEGNQHARDSKDDCPCPCSP